MTLSLDSIARRALPSEEECREAWLVAMSGGVDSAVAALLAVEQGTARAAITMRLSDAAPDGGGAGRCCAPRDIQDARRVAARGGLAHYVVDLRDAFEEEVVAPFVTAYLAGRTPIPCVACNDRLKFRDLVVRARALGAERVVTGHYARREVRGERVHLLRGKDRAKDQSYFLHGLTQEQLRAACFPLGELEKGQVRELARRAGLPVADKAESQEICFVPDGDAAAFVEREALRRGTSVRPGPVVDPSGAEIARHRGVHAFTVGQRRGLGAHGRPLHVLELRVETATVVAGPREALAVRGCRVDRFHWIAGEAPGSPVPAEVQVRHGRHVAAARIEPLAGGGVAVHFDEPQRAVSPGQAAVAYQGDEVLGGGAISAAFGRE